jgi:ferredoxin
MQVCPDVFGLDEEAGKAVILDSEVKDGGDGELIKEAMDSCPIGCISE